MDVPAHAYRTWEAANAYEEKLKRQRVQDPHNTSYASLGSALPSHAGGRHISGLRSSRGRNSLAPSTDSRDSAAPSSRVSLASSNQSRDSATPRGSSTGDPIDFLARGAEIGPSTVVSLFCTAV